MKIIIADDEFYARKAIVQMVSDWNAGMTIIEAEDGSGALEAIEAHRPELVITDIRMPGLDGIRLAAHAFRHHPETMVVIISGFDDFAYAQEAIRYKVEHYLLKPVDRQELYPLLDRWKSRADGLREKEREQELAARLYGQGASSGSSFWAEAEGSGAPYRIAVIKGSAEHRERLKQLVAETLFRRGPHGIVVRDKRYDHLLAAWIPLASGAADRRHELRLQTEVPEAGTAVGFSAVHTDPEELEEAFKEAKIAALQSLVLGNGAICSHEELSGNYIYDGAQIHIWTEAFHRKIANGRVREAADMVHEWLRGAAKRRFSAYMIQDWFATAVKLTNTLIEQLEAESAAAYMEQRSLLEYPSVAEAGEDLIGRLFAIADRTKQSEARMDMVESLKKYVDVNYKSRIQLEELAKTKYFVDPGYLSRLFKRKSGMRFSQYLLSVRMEKARQMLQASADLPVSEVASEVGFNDYSYFIQMYKKFYGETPGKFRSSRNPGE